MTTDVSTKWLTFPRPNPGARLRLFCFSYAGSGASTFRPWLSLLPETVELCAVQLPGRENRMREPALTNLDVVMGILEKIMPTHFDKPFVLFGHSLGAVIAFEVARIARKHQITQLRHLFVSARIAPQAIEQAPPIHQLSEQAFIEKLRELNGTPEIVFEHPEMLEMLIPLLRADFQLNEAYRYYIEPPLAIPLTVLGGLQDPKIRQEELAEWRDQTTAEFQLKMLPGDHFFINTALPAVINLIKDELQADI